MKTRSLAATLLLCSWSLLGCSDDDGNNDADASVTASCVGDIAWYSENAQGTAVAVGGKQANSFGLYDMLGNAIEWVEDCYHETYDGAPTDGSAWDESNCTYRVVRGGCYGSTARGVRVSVRDGVTTGFYGACAPGIRCARTPGSTGAADLGATGDDAGAADGGGTPVTLSWVSIPAGSFQMGCSEGDDACADNESPVHSVTVAAFEMTAREVTQQEYHDQTGESPATSYCPECAVTYVSWDKAKTFCEAVGGRLPTEAEWEYAARAGTTTPYYCGSK